MSNDLRYELPGAQAYLASPRTLIIPWDPTGLLPRLAPAAHAPSQADFARAASTLAVEEAAVRAVSAVEASGGTGFGRDGRPIVRFELHVFQRRTHGLYTQSHPHLSQPYERGRSMHAGGQRVEWSMIYGAMMLRGRVQDALGSASWGAYQVMGSSYAAAGYSSVQDFVNAMHISPATQLDAFASFCKSNHLDRYLIKKDWAGFAAHYNGPKYRENQYDAKLAAAYAHHAKPQLSLQ